MATMLRSQKAACNLVPGLPDPDLSGRVRAAAQQPWSRPDRPEKIGMIQSQRRSAVNTHLDPESRVGGGRGACSPGSVSSVSMLASRWQERGQDQG